MKTYSIIVGVAIFMFDDQDQSACRVGLTRTDDKKLVLPSTLWCDTGTLEATAKHILRTSVYADENWLNLEEMGNVEITMNSPHCSIMSVWRTYIPQNIETNTNIEWIEYARLESVGGRLVGHHLKALRRAFNR